MELASLARRLSRIVLSHPLALKLVLLAVVAAWALPSLAQDAAIGNNTAAGQAAGAGADAEGVSWDGVKKALIVLGVIIVPIVVGNFLAKRLRMPEQGWRLSLALGSLLAAGVIIAMGEIKLGPDLSGGITLIYEVQQQETAGQAGNGPEGDADEQDAGGDPNASGGSNNMASLIKALIERVDPSGTKEVSIKQFGEDQIEIIIPRAEKSELEAIERRIYTAGVLEFRITASPQFSKHASYIREAEKLPPGQNIVRIGGREVARWVAYDQRQFGTPEQAQQMGLVTRMSGETPQALVITDDGLDVTGDYLRSAASDVDQYGGPAVSFKFDRQGAFRFRQLTQAHQPNPSGQKYNLGILLDNRLLSAPSLNAVISDQGIIEGLDDEDEVEFLVGILNAGSLPASLNKVPISRAQISPTLGKTTVEKGQQSLIISLALVALFMVFYYKKAGFISWFGLASNMLLILGCMVLIKAAFTLPGLAGLVLSVGMSVDANVLIYERIREELKRGAALRMAIRNGFNRASITIFDSNITNLITAAVIYKIAPDSVKGFGVTLFLGIMMSVYTAVFLTRIVFDIAERRGWLRNMSMREFVGETHINFLGWGKAAMAASLLLIGVGVYAVYDRGRDLLDIDFTGGSSVTIVLREDQKLTFAEVDEVLQQTELAEENLSLVEVGEGNTRYTITTINDNVEAVEDILAKAFAGKLETYQVAVEDVQSIPATGEAVGSADMLRQLRRGLPSLPTPMSYLALLQETPAEGETPAETPAEESAAQPAEEADADPAEPAEEGAEGAPAPTAGSEPTAPAEEPADTAPAAPAEGTTADNAPSAEEDASATAEESGDDAAEEAASAGGTAGAGDRFAGGTSARLTFSGGTEADQQAGVSHDTLVQMLNDALQAAGHTDVAVEAANPDYEEGTTRTFTTWDVNMALPETAAQEVLGSLAADINDDPVFPLSNKIGSRVAGRMATDAIAAIVLCLIGIIAYVWFRFHGVIYGIAAVVALIHDVLVALGFVALSAYLVSAVPPLAEALLIDKFQINLVLVAAFLTIIGYSLNDTIVIFDRIREVKGKSPRLTRDMINLAVNQTLSRTVLTAVTTLMSVVVLYIFGGPGIHAFAFTLLVGFVAGLYSTIFIANPVLMWLASRFEGAEAAPAAKAA
ncbi:MAG TPA: protein translocase subunit SecD [Lacipirellula sp.]